MLGKEEHTNRSREVIQIPKPPERLRGQLRVGTALAFFGPGAIVASLTIGSGETVFAARVGAGFGYAILWTAFITLIAKGALDYASNHYITVTGEGVYCQGDPRDHGQVAVVISEGDVLQPPRYVPRAACFRSGSAASGNGSMGGRT